MEKFHMFDDRIYQMTNGVKAADRIIYTVMLNEQKFYHDKGQYYTPSYAHLGQYAGITRTSVIACMKQLEAHGLIKKTNVASNQCVIKVYSLDEVPEVLTELTAKEARKAKLESKVTQSVKKDDPLSQNSLLSQSKSLTRIITVITRKNLLITIKKMTLKKNILRRELRSVIHMNVILLVLKRLLKRLLKHLT
ncbi:hypothetical protein ACFMQO_003656 [Shigella sonnei]|uniref:hypothetical protein n=1 Tax=Shigella sonnei TaxID=624 RepID=UPI000662D44E|nr:hypothetical protein [Shigella sonnei]CSL14026.1 Uncharacterised protein [Shigella sonnei]CSO05841.1 Uncharacterised protein [Shigella sonnei]CSP63897.1 Uncharacterised protein [Shigella sonnei]SRJ51416.1 Uncharacterised protein [Shigella sonnei]SRJ68525.1 Uncharacterised protein [Shigella sonnei]